MIAQALAAVRAPVLLVHGAEDTPTRAPGRCPSASAPDRRTADLIYEVVGGATGADAVRTLAPGGRIAMVGSASGAPVALDPIDVILRDYSAVGVLAGQDPEADEIAWPRLVEFVEPGRLSTPVGRERSFDSVPTMIAQQGAPPPGKSVVWIS